uniref:Bm10747 n=1 Tax=Brugia malayi TaxID=6279 RepID=A0A1I9G477_BRUMA|nr:Bm10747 [Brugia malayi]
MRAPAATIAGNGMTALRTTVMTVKWCGGGVGAVRWWWCCSLIIMHDRFRILLFVPSRTFHLQNVNLRRATIIHPISQLAAPMYEVTFAGVKSRSQHSWWDLLNGAVVTYRLDLQPES